MREYVCGILSVFDAIILLSTFLRPYFFFLPPSTIAILQHPVQFDGEGGGGGNKANLLTLNRRDGAAARIKLRRGESPTAERRRRYRRNDYFPRGLTSDFVALSPAPRPPISQTRSRTANFYVRD